MRRSRYDVVVVGARCAGASTAMLMARQGMRVLALDAGRRGSDTLSTHALMRGGVLQLARWGLLPSLRAAGTPPVRTTSFHYGPDSVTVPIKDRDGVDALYAPRRTVLDRILVEAAEAAGATVVHGVRAVGVIRNAEGRVRGVRVGSPDGRVRDVRTDLLVGADGLRSRVAGMVGARTYHTADHATAAIYAHVGGLDTGAGYHWHYARGASVGTIPTNEGATCVFASLPAARFQAELKRGVDVHFHETLQWVDPELAARIRAVEPMPRLRAFAGAKGFLRESAGPGWALVGDAGYFRDPLTAHGMTDALRDAELLARAVARGDEAVAAYPVTRDGLVRRLMDVTDRVASFEWDLADVKALHLALSREMSAEVDFLLGLDTDAGAAPTPRFPRSAARAS